MTVSGYEQGLLAGLLARPEYCSTLLLQSSDFASPVAGAIFDVILKVSNPTPVAITEELTRSGRPVDSSLLHRLFALKPDSTTKDELDQYAARIRNDAIAKRLQQRINRSIPQLKTGDNLSDAIASISQAVIAANNESIAGFDPDAHAIVSRMGNQEMSDYFRSGIDIIDTATQGMRHGHVWIITGAYKSRKSTLALHIVKSVLEQGKSVAYIALEDTDVTFVQNLLAIVGDYSVHWYEASFRTDEIRQKMAASEAWLAGKHFRVYDAKYGVHDFQKVPALIRGDKLQYDTDLVVADYVQAWTEEYEELTKVAQTLLKMAAENSVCLLEISQVSGETMRMGSGRGMLATKGTQAFGATCHVGLELRYAPQRAGKKPVPQRIPHDLGAAAEIGVHLKVARRAPPQWAFLIINPVSGLVVEQSAAPLYPSAPGKID